MESKWLANSYDDAVTFEHRLGYGTDTKFYVVGFEIDDEILSGAYKVKKTRCNWRCSSNRCRSAQQLYPHCDFYQ